MKRFVFTFRVEPPHLETVTARSGGLVFDAAYSRTLNQWYHCLPGGSLEKIDTPEMLFLDDEYARAHARLFTFSRSNEVVKMNKPSRLRKTKPVQLSLFT